MRDLPEHPLLVSSKVHLGEPEMATLAETRALVGEIGKRLHELDQDCLPTIERKIDRVRDDLRLVNDRLDLLIQRRG